MHGIKSLGESLEWEGGEIKRQTAIDVANITGEDMVLLDAQANAEGADVGNTSIMIAGDVLIGERERQLAQQQEPLKPAPADQTTTPAPTKVEPATPAPTPVPVAVTPAPAPLPLRTDPATTPTTTTSETTTTTKSRSWVLPAVVAAAVGIPLAAGGVYYATRPSTQTTTINNPSSPAEKDAYKFQISSEHGKGMKTE